MESSRVSTVLDGRAGGLKLAEREGFGALVIHALVRVLAEQPPPAARGDSSGGRRIDGPSNVVAAPVAS